MGSRVRDVGGRLVVAVRRQDGATAVEYALMVALIALVVVAAVTLLGQETSSAYSDPTLLSGLSG
jgi:pilus assembly protein Flp/PilA